MWRKKMEKEDKKVKTKTIASDEDEKEGAEGTVASGQAMEKPGQTSETKIKVEAGYLETETGIEKMSKRLAQVNHKIMTMTGPHT